MAYGYVQQAVATALGSSNTIASGAFGSSVAAHDCLFWAVAWNGNDETVTLAGNGNTYTERGHIWNSFSRYGIRWGEAKDVNAGTSGAIATFSNAVDDQRAIVLREYSGVDLSAPFGEQIGEPSGGGTAATDGWTSGTATPGVQPAAVIALGFNITGSAPLTAGTGFGNFTNTWNWGFGNQGFIADKRITSLSPAAATFSCAAAGDGGQIAMLILREAAALGPVLSVAQMIEMCRPNVLKRM